jgi:hypothetical protein
MASAGRSSRSTTWSRRHGSCPPGISGNPHEPAVALLEQPAQDRASGHPRGSEASHRRSCTCSGRQPAGRDTIRSDPAP